MLLRKVFFLASWCVLMSVSGFAQEGQIPAEENQEIGVADIYLAKPGADGKAGEAAAVFAPTDVPLFCVITLKSAQAVAVKMHLVELANKLGQPTIKIDYKTSGTQTRVNFKFSPEKIWTAGKYRVDVLLDGKLAASRTFEIEISKTETEKNKAPVQKAKPKSLKRPKKN